MHCGVYAVSSTRLGVSRNSVKSSHHPPYFITEKFALQVVKQLSQDPTFCAISTLLDNGNSLDLQGAQFCPYVCNKDHMTQWVFLIYSPRNRLELY